MYAKLALISTLLLLIQMGSSEGGGNNHMHHVHPSHLHHHHPTTDPDPALSIFFFPEDLKIGNTMKIYFPKRQLSDSLPHLLSKEEADSLPFSSPKLPEILRLFSFPSESPQAAAMAATLEECDRPPIQGELKFCATSSQSMSEFISTIFGPDTLTEAVATYHLKRSESSDKVQNYRINGIRRIPSPKMVSCHTMPYAYTVFYCHYHDSDNRVFRVSLAGESGDEEVEAIAVCHMDTSQWGPTHVAFRVLGVGPGSTPVCHFFPADNFVWVPKMSTAQI